jgi:hypothetical protein
MTPFRRQWVSKRSPVFTMISHDVKFKFVYHYLDDLLYCDMKVQSQNCGAGRDIVDRVKLCKHIWTATESRDAATVSTQQQRNRWRRCCVLGLCRGDIRRACRQVQPPESENADVKQSLSSEDRIRWTRKPRNLQRWGEDLVHAVVNCRVWISDSAVINCNYGFKSLINPITKTKAPLYSLNT